MDCNAVLIIDDVELNPEPPTTPTEPLTNETWMAYARNLSFYLYQSFSPRDYDRYKMNKDVPMLDELQILKTRICYLRYGQPLFDNDRGTLFELEPSEEVKNLVENLSTDFESPFDYYTLDQRREAEELAEVIFNLKNPNDDFVDVCILFCCFWLPLKLADDADKQNSGDESKIYPEVVPMPLFRVSSIKDNIETVRFVDFTKRVYSSWEQYLKNNVLPPGIICYPSNGFYTFHETKMPHNADTLLLEFQFTAASGTTAKLLEFGDNANTYLAIGSLTATGVGLLLGLGSIAAAPVVLGGAAFSGGVSAIYGAARGIGRLGDRYIHKQSINITNSESRSCWIAILSTAAAGASMGFTRYLDTAAFNASEIGTSAIYTTNILMGTNVIIGFAGLVNNGHQVFLQVRNENRKPSTFEIMNFTLSALLFTHSLVNFKTANTIIEEASSARVSEIQQGLDTKKSQKGFDRVLKNIDEPNVIIRNKRIIRTVNNVDDTRVFFRKVYDLTRANNREGYNQKITFGDNGGLFVGQKEFSAGAINQLSISEQTAFLNALSSSGNVELTETPVYKKLDNITVATRNDKKKKANNNAEETKIFTNRNLIVCGSVIFNHLPKIAKLLNDVKDPANVEIIIIISKDISSRLGFQKLSSFLETLRLVRNWFSKQQISKNKVQVSDNTISRNLMFVAFRDLHNQEHNFKFKSPEEALKNYLSNFPLTSQNVMSVNVYWQTIQEIFKHGTYDSDAIDGFVRVVDTNQWFGKCRFYAPDYANGIILSLTAK